MEDTEKFTPTKESPVLRDLRCDIDQLARSKGHKIGDHQPFVVNLCKTLESAFRHGLVRDGRGEASDLFDVVLNLAKSQCSSTGVQKRCAIPLTALARLAIDQVCSEKCVSTSKGRSRLFLRYGLNGQWLGQMIIAMQNWEEIEAYYRQDALLRQPRGQDSLLTLVEYMIDECSFHLNLDNGVFLDRAWDRPTYKRFELVPCRDLGLMVCSVSGHIIVTRVKTYSVAGEDGKVEVGDLLLTIDGMSLFDVAPEYIAKLVKRCGAKRPIAMSVAKAKSHNASVFPPLGPYLNEAGIDVRKLEKLWRNQQQAWRCKSNDGDDIDDHLEDLLRDSDQDDLDTSNDDDVFLDKDANPKDMYMAKGGYQLTYIGSLQVGRIGDTSFLDRSIRRVVNDANRVEHDISLHILEFGIRMYCTTSGTQVLSYPYPKISACGCYTTNPQYFAFIGGDNLCRLAEHFLCHVFYIPDANISREIVANMAAGFDRTLSAA